ADRAASKRLQRNYVRTQLSELLEELLGIRGGRRNQLRRGDGPRLGGGAAYAGPFRVVEEEQSVFDDRATDGVAELVACDYRLRDAVGVIVEGVGSERRNPVELVGGSVQIIRTGFGRDVDHPARRPS